MPNHTANLLTLSGPAQAIQDAIALLAGETAMDFNRILPMPAELRDVHSGGCTIEGVYRTRWREQPGPDGKAVNVAIPEEELERWRREYRACDWWEWGIANWGTKWNAYTVGEWEISRSGTIASIRFETAWSPPEPVMLALSARFPGLDVSLEYADEMGNFLGVGRWRDGNQIHEAAYDHSDDGNPIVRAMKGRLGHLWDEEAVAA